jgi:hypothetical protein
MKIVASAAKAEDFANNPIGHIARINSPSR